MAAPRSPNKSSPLLPQPKKSVFSAAIASTSRRQSLSNVPSNFSPHSPSQGIGFSPGSSSQQHIATPTTPASPGSGTGIPSFKSLRSLLPFGPNRNASSSSVTSTPPNSSTSRSPFSNFGSVRRSMQRDRDRKTSLSNDVSPVLAIENSMNEAPVRRSVSLPRLEKPLPEKPSSSAMHRESFLRNSLGDEESRRNSAYTLRTPSPGPPLSAELSTIIEADNSGVSKHAHFFSMTSPPTPSRSSSPPIIDRDLLHPEAPHSHGDPSGKPLNPASSSEFENEGETFAMDLDTSHLADQVRDALRGTDGSPNSAKEWRNVDKDTVIIDTDDDELAVGDKTFNMDPTDVDPLLAALLSPNSLMSSKNGSSHSLQRSHGPSESTKTSPTTPTFQHGTSPSSRLPRSRQASSFLPRLKSSNLSPAPSPTSPKFVLPTPTSPTSCPVTPRASPVKPRTPIIALNGHDYTPSSPVSPQTSPTTPSSILNTSTPAKKPSSNRFFSPNKLSLKTTSDARLSNGTDVNITPKTTAPPNSRTRTLREVMLGVSKANSADSGSPATPSASSLHPMVGRASLDARRPIPYQSTNESIGLGRPSLELRRGNSHDSRMSSNSRTPTYPSPTSISGTGDDLATEPGSSPETQFTEPAMFHTPYRPSLDSISTRPSLDTSSRPSSSATRLKQRDRERDFSPRDNVLGNHGPPPERTRKRSMSVQERWGTPKAKSVAHGVAASEAGGPTASRPGSSMSLHGGVGRRGVYNGFSSSVTDVNDLSPSGPSPKMEWLGPRTAKAFKAAGLLDFEKERERERERERETFDTPTEARYYRDRSGSVNGVLAPSPLGSNGPAAALNRFASMRSASEYNPSTNRAQSRMAFSEVGGPSGRRESGTFSQYAGSSYGPPGLMESPTFTASSGSRGGDRDTPRSGTSTAPTSVSESFGYFSRSTGDRDLREREREREREELRDLKERHTTEMGALLNALSDSQRTVRLLRDENSELRERLERLEAIVRENNSLRQACGEMQLETTSLRRECADLRSQVVMAKTMSRTSVTAGALSVSRTSSGSSGLRTPIPRAGNSSPLARTFIPQAEVEENESHPPGDNFDTTIIIHDDIDDDQPLPQYLQMRHPEQADHKTGDVQRFSIEDLEPSSSSTPSTKRRLSDTSSIFPIPPANMTMLLYDDTHANLGSPANSNQSSAEHSFYPTQASFLSSPLNDSRANSTATPTRSRAISFSRSPAQPNGFGDESMGYILNKSVSSATSISPTTANFSMATGSPGSLYLRPEHEVLLGDMESLDLSVRNIDLELDAGRMSDGW